ncbi:hypothetical protein Krac_1739 [Ktedonobacter racemifer DSM 44963]|uniref:Uncharacterized protein n=1 Tax=Ktedonobacter racemifer DSM 44963 TaxID=485913 RepID=D6U361_KTERA|nr:hypothetical protein Krac_1739 [Ktedonobacter racemifer DSM 44963]
MFSIPPLFFFGLSRVVSLVLARRRVGKRTAGGLRGSSERCRACEGRGKACVLCSWFREIEAIIGDVKATVEGGAFDDAVRLKGWEVEGGRALLR